MKPGLETIISTTTWCTLAVKDSFCRVGWLWMDQKTQHHSKHTQSGFSCLNWVLLFCLCPADGGSEHFQAKRFVSGSGETALLCAQSAPRRKHYLYPLSRSSLHRNSQYQPCPREWVRRTHAHKHTLTLTRIHAHAHADTFSLTHTQSHLAARHVDCSTLTLLSGCVPSGSLAARLCAMFPLSSGPPL